MRVLYLTGEVPYPVTSGGKRAMSNHLHLLRDLTDWQVTVVALDVDGDRLNNDWGLPTERFSIHCLPRSQPRLRGAGGALSAMASLLFSPDPRPVQVRRSRQVSDFIASLLNGTQIQAVVFEHIAAFGMLPDSLPNHMPMIHISQNVESKVAWDQWRSLPWTHFLKTALLIDALKMRRCERRMLATVDGTICISGDDASILAPLTHAPVLGWTEPYWPHRERWRGSDEHGLLFVGSAGYFPNAEAMRWLVELLMPALRDIDGKARLFLAGTSEAELRRVCPDGWPADIVPLGFIPEEEKHRLHQNCALFLCPIVSGSGVKMKALDAMAYGMPMQCTPECLVGVTQGDDTLAIGQLDWRDPQASAQKVAALLSDRTALERLGHRGEEILSQRNSRAREFVDFISGIADSWAKP